LRQDNWAGQAQLTAMAHGTTAPAQANGPSAKWLSSLRCALAAFTRRVWLYRQVQQERAQLRALSDRELRDIGISRSDALREAKKPFWR